MFDRRDTKSIPRSNRKDNVIYWTSKDGDMFYDETSYKRIYNMVNYESGDGKPSNKFFKGPNNSSYPV